MISSASRVYLEAATADWFNELTLNFIDSLQTVELHMWTADYKKFMSIDVLINSL